MRASDLSLKQVNLPKKEWTTLQTERPYMGPYLREVYQEVEDRLWWRYTFDNFLIVHHRDFNNNVDDHLFFRILCNSFLFFKTHFSIGKVSLFHQNENHNVI